MTRLLFGDCREVLARLGTASVDAVVTDPPYELGFMGKKWDSTGIAYDVDLWREVARVLKPGGHVLAFGATRTYHRMACAIEDAELEIRDSLHWMYGSGFPKGLDPAKSLDKHSGIWRGRAGAVMSDNTAMSGGNYERAPKGRAVTEAAANWEGWNTALKPAHEPFVLARKTFDTTLIDNILAYGTGPINIDICRVPSDDGFEKAWDNPVRTNIGAKGGAYITTGEQHEVDITANRPVGGRWPPNVVLSHGPGCVPGACLSGCPVFGLDAQESGVSKFFPVIDLDTDYGDPFYYASKVSRSEREAGCERFDVRPAGGLIGRNDGTLGGEPVKRRNNHPTVKPWRLMQWCINLVTPPGGIVLDPFMGSGSTGIAAVHSRRMFIGIEREPDYLGIARARIAHAQSLYEY